MISDQSDLIIVATVNDNQLLLKYNQYYSGTSTSLTTSEMTTVDILSSLYMYYYVHNNC